MDNVMTKFDLALKMAEMNDIVNANMIKKERLKDLLDSDCVALKNRLETALSQDTFSFNNNLPTLDIWAKQYLSNSEKYQAQCQKYYELNSELRQLQQLWKTERYIGGSNEGKPLNL